MSGYGRLFLKRTTELQIHVPKVEIVERGTEAYVQIKLDGHPTPEVLLLDMPPGGARQLAEDILASLRFVYECRHCHVKSMIIEGRDYCPHCNEGKDP